MSYLLAFIILICLVAFAVFAFKTIMSFVKKDQTRAINNLKFAGSFFIFMLVALAALGVVEDNKNKKSTLQTVSVDSTNVSKSEKDYYLNQTKPYIDDLLTKFDGTWDVFWKETATKMANKEIGAKEAINQFTILKAAYQVLQRDNTNPPVEKLSTVNQNNVNDFIDNLNKAIDKRTEAADLTIGVLQQGNFSDMQKPLDVIKESDDYILRAALALAKLKTTFEDEKPNSN